MDGEALAGALREKAIELGFDLFGVTGAGDFLDDLEAFSARLAAGQLEGMAWLNEERARLASSPERLLPGAKSVIVLGMSYLMEAAPAEETTGPTGQVARYARGRDYHNVIRPKLRALVREMETLLGRPVAARLFVDSGPFVERAAARRAGIGWVGKNTLVLNKRFGSWTFLAAIISDVELPEGAPVATNCGNCRRCLDVCPTGALPEPFVLDATRCISYLTIEHRGSIDPALRPAMADLVFGCDLCQDVCPVNRKALPGRMADFLPKLQAGDSLSLLQILSIGDAEFDETFRGSPIRRAKRAGLARNAAIAIGNSGDPAAVPALALALNTDVDPAVRGQAAWAIGRIGGDAARSALQSAFDEDESVRAEIRAALEAIDAGQP